MTKANKNNKRGKRVQDTSVETSEKPRSIFSVLFFACWILCVCSAFGVVYSTFETRKATQELEELRREAAGLKVVSGQYLLEQSSLGAYSRVETIATKKLRMLRPGPEHTVLVAR